MLNIIAFHNKTKRVLYFLALKNVSKNVYLNLGGLLTLEVLKIESVVVVFISGKHQVL